MKCGAYQSQPQHNGPIVIANGAGGKAGEERQILRGNQKSRIRRKQSNSNADA